MVSRRLIQTVLGLFWFLESMFQLNPKVISFLLFSHVVPIALEKVDGIGSLFHGETGIASTQTALWSVSFAVLQMLIGLALIFNFHIKSTLLLSFIWSGGVWVFGGAAGSLLSGQAMVLDGISGTILLQGLISLAIWPAKHGTPSSWNQRSIRFAQVSLGVLFALGFVLHFQITYLMQEGWSQFNAIPWLRTLAVYQGTGVSIVLAMVELAAAFMFIWKIRLNWATWLSMILDLLWNAGQSLGTILDPMTPDFTSAILLTLLVVCAAPHQFWHPATKRTNINRKAVFH